MYEDLILATTTQMIQNNTMQYKYKGDLQTALLDDLRSNLNLELSSDIYQIKNALTEPQHFDLKQQLDLELKVLLKNYIMNWDIPRLLDHQSYQEKIDDMYHELKGATLFFLGIEVHYDTQLEALAQFQKPEFTKDKDKSNKLDQKKQRLELRKKNALEDEKRMRKEAIITPFQIIMQCNYEPARESHQELTEEQASKPESAREHPRHAHVVRPEGKHSTDGDIELMPINGKKIRNCQASVAWGI